ADSGAVNDSAMRPVPTPRPSARQRDLGPLDDLVFVRGGAERFAYGKAVRTLLLMRGMDRLLSAPVDALAAQAIQHAGLGERRQDGRLEGGKMHVSAALALPFDHLVNSLHPHVVERGHPSER